MSRGGGAGDWGFLTLDEEEASRLQRDYPEMRKYIRPFSMGAEFIKGVRRYCLWFAGVSGAELSKLPSRIKDRFEEVRSRRAASPRAGTRKRAEKPWEFDELKVPQEGAYLAVPQVSSGRRRYVPIGYITDGTIPGNKLFFVEGAEIYDFGIIASQFHNAWMRQVAGRLKSDYQYSNTIVYNNFIWPEPSDKDKEKVERCARAVLDVREAQQGATLAEMYSPDNEAFFPDLMRAHRELDAAVEAAYGVDFNGDEEKIVAHLFKLYAEKTGA